MLDITKPVQTECGYEAEIIKDDCLGDYPLVVVIKTSPSRQRAYSYNLEGSPYLLSRPSELCLVNVTGKRTIWIKEYADGSILSFETRPVIDGARSLVKHTFTSGQIDE